MGERLPSPCHLGVKRKSKEAKKEENRKEGERKRKEGKRRRKEWKRRRKNGERKRKDGEKEAKNGKLDRSENTASGWLVGRSRLGGLWPRNIRAHVGLLLTATSG